MKMAKSYKILLFVMVFVLSVMLGLYSFSFKPASAETVTPKITDYFSGVVSNDMSFDATTDNAKFEVFSGNEIAIKNKLVVDNFKTDVVLSADVEKVEFTLKYDSFYVNGNKKVEKVDGKDVVSFDKTIVNKFEITSSGEIAVVVEDNVVKVNGEAKSDEYYKIRVVDRAVAEVSFKVFLKDSVEKGSFEIKYVDQDASNTEGLYKQTFKLEGGKLNAAQPIVTVNAPIFVKTANGYEVMAYAQDLTSYALTYNVYAVLNNVSTSELYPVSSDANVNIPKDEDATNLNKLYFKNAGTASFDICSTDGVKEVKYTTYNVKVLEKLDAEDTTNSAPVYVDDALAKEAFEAELKKQYYKEDIDVGENESNYVALGSTLQIPSLEDLVVDDRTPYSKLSKMVYYVCSNPLTANGALEIKLEVLGDYYFYVVFEDLDGKGMDKDNDFRQLDENGIPNGGSEKYKDYVFNFSIEDDAAISVTSAKSQVDGFVGTKYTASKFDIKAVNSVEKFTLWYNSKFSATKDSDGWVEIKQYEDADETYNENGFTYENLKSIDYDGQYVFRPDRAGSYMIKCVVSSEISFREASDSTIIRVSGDPKVVTPANHWLRDNVWSVVFLSVGSLCLVAIIVLLCIKPKEKRSED